MWNEKLKPVLLSLHRIIKLTCLAEYLFHISNLWTDNYLNYLYESNFYALTVLHRTSCGRMGYWKYVCVKWENKGRGFLRVSFLCIQKPLLKVCLCAFNIPWVANFLPFFFFPYQNHWALLIFKAKAAKLRSRDTEIGRWKNIKWLKNIVLTRVVQIKKKLKNPIRNKSHRKCEHIVFLK